MNVFEKGSNPTFKIEGTEPAFPAFSAFLDLDSRSDAGYAGNADAGSSRFAGFSQRSRLISAPSD